jgi:aldose 1-epimerase
VLYTLEDRPFVAVEPMTNANDGFNLLAQGIEGSGVFVLEPGETVRGEVRLNFSAVEEV